MNRLAPAARASVAAVARPTIVSGLRVQPGNPAGAGGVGRRFG
jgi:hypothetical protein